MFLVNPMCSICIHIPYMYLFKKIIYPFLFLQLFIYLLQMLFIYKCIINLIYLFSNLFIIIFIPKCVSLVPHVFIDCSFRHFFSIFIYLQMYFLIDLFTNTFIDLL